MELALQSTIPLKSMIHGQLEMVEEFGGSYASLTAAAALLWIMFLGVSNKTASALEKAIDAVKNVEIVRFDVHAFYGANLEQKSAVTVAKNKLQVDGIGDGIRWIVDMDAKGALIVKDSERICQTVDMTDGGIMPFDVFGMNVRNQLLELRNQKADLIGIDLVNGKTAEGYVIKGGKAFHTEGNWELWIGLKSGLPLKVTVQFEQRGVTTKMIYDSFDWNPKADNSAFAIDPPEGYEERTVLRFFPPLPQRTK